MPFCVSQIISIYFTCQFLQLHHIYSHLLSTSRSWLPRRLSKAASKSTSAPNASPTKSAGQSLLLATGTIGVAAAVATTATVCWRNHQQWKSKLVSDPNFESVQFVRAPLPSNKNDAENDDEESAAFCWLPTDVYRALPGVASMPVRDSDVFVVSFPKAGTTWLQELVFMLATDFDVKLAETVSIEDRFPYLEYPYPGLATIERWPVKTSRRFIKSHLPWDLLPRAVVDKELSKSSKAKVIYLARCPKDTCISYYHFVRMLRPLICYSGDWQDFVDRFLDSSNRPLPYGPWPDHVDAFWQKSIDRPQQVLFLTYEQLQADAGGCVRRIARFLGLDEPDERRVNEIVSFCSFNRMRVRPTTSYSWYRRYGAHDPQMGFYRGGQAGGWRQLMSADEAVRFDAELLGPLRLQRGLRLGDLLAGQSLPDAEGRP